MLVYAALLFFVHVLFLIPYCLTAAILQTLHESTVRIFLLFIVALTEHNLLLNCLNLFMKILYFPRPIITQFQQLILWFTLTTELQYLHIEHILITKKIISKHIPSTKLFLINQLILFHKVVLYEGRTTFF